MYLLTGMLLLLLYGDLEAIYSPLSDRVILQSSGYLVYESLALFISFYLLTVACNAAVTYLIHENLTPIYFPLSYRSLQCCSHLFNS